MIPERGSDGPLNPQQIAQVAEARSQSAATLRPTVEALEEILFEPLPVLDHGFVRVVDYMGDDAAIVQAARVSYGRGTRRTRDDRGLINYLIRNWHTSPFEMCELKLHVKLPIFVARQWIRHRTANVNEISARYSVLENEFYVPDIDQIRLQSQSNRQGRGERVDVEQAERVIELLRSEALRSYRNYEDLLGSDAPAADGEPDPERPALARELARINLSLSVYTEWYWKVDLHNLMHFLRLRADAHAQFEIRAYAEVIHQEVLRRWVPLSCQAFENHRLGGVQLSADQLAVVRRMVHGEKVERQGTGISPGEWRELMGTLGLA